MNDQSTSADSVVTTSSDDTGSVQRATLYVPTYESIVSLGAAYAPDSVTRTQAGFTMTTTKHVFLRAAKAVTMQADGHVWLQSTEDSTYSIAGENAYLIAGTGMYVGGGGYVGFMAGYTGELLDTDDDFTGTDPSPPDGFESAMDTAFLAADLTQQIFGKFISAGNYVHFLVEHLHYLEWKTLTWWRKLLWQSLTTLLPTGLWMYSRAKGAEFRSLNFFSEAGILSATPAFTSIHGLFSVNTRSFHTTILGLVRVNMEGGINSTLDSIFGDTSVRTLSALSVLSFKECKLASRQGALAFYGSTVEIGGTSPSGKQLPTVEAKLAAVREIALNAGGTRGNVRVAADPILGSKLATKSIGFEAKSTGDTTVKALSIAGVYEISLSADAIVITSATGEVVRLSAAGVMLGPASGQIQLTAGGANLAGGAFNVSDASITAMSGTVDIL